MYETFFRWLVSANVDPNMAAYVARYGSIFLAILATIIMYFVARRLLLNWVIAWSKKSKTNWDDAFLHNRVFSRVAWLIPTLVVMFLAPVALDGYVYANSLTIVNHVVQTIFAAQVLLILDGLLGATREIMNNYEATRNLPIDSVSQLLRVLLYIFGGIVVVSYAVGQTPIYFLSGLGALTAVLSFIYQDALRGLVAGIQLTANKLLGKGDLIEMPTYNVSGTVLEVGLTTVKVQNFDYSITTVPTYALITDSFKNWRGMEAADGRRIVRTILLDVNSVRFCDEALLSELKKITLLAPFLAERQAEIADHNEALEGDLAMPINGRRLTNLGLFRAYLTAYLRDHDLINQDMTLMVRQLEPSTSGVGLQIYAFCRDKTWDTYEGVMADMFDHIIAAAPYFDLSIYQAPAGADIRSINSVN